jgi:nucleoside-diphosphate-sugar epimerase
MIPTVAVLGAGGFIGNRLVETLHLRGEHRVRPVVRRAASLALSARFPLDGRLADARDEAALTAAFSGCTHVVHAVAGPPDTVIGAVAPVYRAAAASGVRRLVYLSSASVHGQSPAEGTDEDSPLSPHQPVAYNNAKVAAERILQDLRRGGEVETVRLRPGIVHGPRSYWTGGFADELLAGEAYLVAGGRGICNSIYVDNLVEAVRLALAERRADGMAYIVGDAETVTWADLCQPIATALGRTLDEISVAAPARTRAPARLDPSRPLRAAATLLPSRPRRALRAAITELRGARRASGGEIRVSEEKAALHTCRVRLPIDRAQRELGYRPVVDFATACRHAVSWLAFAGYPVEWSAEARPADARPSMSQQARSLTE